MSNCETVSTVTDWFSNDCTGQANNQQFFNNLFTNFFTEGELWIPGINNPTSDQLNFQYLIAGLCNENQNGGFCSQNLTQLCQNYTREDTINPLVQQFCGCYLNSSQYNQSIQRSCDPVCSNINNINYFPSSTATSPETCNSSVCVIDNVTIQAVSSTVGQITFSELCTNCGVAGSCECIIGDIDIISQNSILAGVNLTQNCGGGVLCFDSNQNPVNCSQFLSSTATQGSQKTQFFYYLIGFGIIALLIFILFVIAFTKS